MIIVAVEVHVEAGSAERAKEAIAKMEEATRKEEGCVTYAFSLDINDPTTIRVIERWRSLDDIKAHMASPHMADFNHAMAAIRPSGLDVKAYEVEREIALA